MSAITLENVSLSFAAKPQPFTVLDDISLSLEKGEFVVLLGPSGCGKSTILNLVAGFNKPDRGRVAAGGKTVKLPGPDRGMIFQQPNLFPWLSVLENVTFGPRLGKYHKDEVNAQALDWLTRVGLKGFEHHAPWQLSGGMKQRVALARALVASENLLLDEPTNHLDIKTIAWLEDFLVRRVKTFVFISHDRAFVRRLATRIVEVDRSQLYSYACTFDQFLERREERLDAEEKQAAAFDKKLAQEEAWIRQGIKARRTRNMGRVRALQAMRSERMARVSRQGVVSMLAQEAERSGKLVIEAKQAGFAYPDGYRVFNAFSTIIQRGDRIGLIGNNGVGKTTLLRLLLGELEPTEGSIRHGTRLEVSYFDQLRSSLDPEKSVMDNVANGNDTVTINGQQRHVASYLMDFLFESDRLRVPVHTLSGGERNRLLLAKLFTMPSNLLVLDEPTNDLDVETLELLEELLASYSGTVLMVSHDREFLDNLVTTTLALEGDGQVREYVGGYTDWLRQRPEPVAAHTDKPKPKPLAPPAKIGPRKLTFKEQRELQMLKDELEALPGKMAALEDEQHTLEDRLNDPGFFARDPDGFNATAKRISELDDEQTAALQRWEDVEFRIAELKGKAEDIKPSLENAP